MLTGGVARPRRLAATLGARVFDGAPAARGSTAVDPDPRPREAALRSPRCARPLTRARGSFDGRREGSLETMKGPRPAGVVRDGACWSRARHPVRSYAFATGSRRAPRPARLADSAKPSVPSGTRNQAASGCSIFSSRRVWRGNYESPARVRIAGRVRRRRKEIASGCG